MCAVALQEEVLSQHSGDACGVCQHCPPGGAKDPGERAVPPGAHHGLEHLCLHHPGHRFDRIPPTTSFTPTSFIHSADAFVSKRCTVQCKGPIKKTKSKAKML